MIWGQLSIKLFLEKQEQAADENGYTTDDGAESGQGKAGNRWFGRQLSHIGRSGSSGW